jgi:acyl carrier protein
MLFRPAFQPEPKIADVIHRLLRDRSIDREFTLQDNLRDVGLTSLDMTSLVLAVEGEFSIRIPDRAITPANFMSVATIGRLVATLANAHGVTPSRPAPAGGADLESTSSSGRGPWARKSIRSDRFDGIDRLIQLSQLVL